MKKTGLMATWVTTVALAAAGAALAQHNHGGGSAGPYAGMEQRPIKSLDPRTVQGLRRGDGLGHAMAAELNGYPGPLHTLELADRLQLTPEQRAATQRLHDDHKARARVLGERVLQAEADLDALFARREANPERVIDATRRVADLQAQLRAEHLNTHLAQTALMSSEQVSRYVELRGYRGGGAGHGQGHGQGHGHRH